MSQQEQVSRTENMLKLREMIKDIQFAMFTTQEPDGTLRSRPMGTQQTEFDGDLWFFTGDDSPKADEIRHEHQV
ncbi:MAG: pyridoxamine 5'-phosphate oxidase family protein, partial [Chloroflexaceae bacterium]|nr:pyridoxamine 5'-phosphate oxidase family protein [Chloroflexaceae bacterium]